MQGFQCVYLPTAGEWEEHPTQEYIEKATEACDNLVGYIDGPKEDGPADVLETPSPARCDAINIQAGGQTCFKTCAQNIDGTPFEGDILKNSLKVPTDKGKEWMSMIRTDCSPPVAPPRALPALRRSRRRRRRNAGRTRTPTTTGWSSDAQSLRRTGRATTARSTRASSWRARRATVFHRAAINYMDNKKACFKNCGGSPDYKVRRPVYYEHSV